MKKLTTLLALALCLNGKAQCHVTQIGQTQPTCNGVCDGTASFNIPSACYSNPVYAVWSNLPGCTIIPTGTITAGTSYTVGGLCTSLNAYVVLFTNNPDSQDSAYAQFAIYLTNPPPPVIQTPFVLHQPTCGFCDGYIVMSIGLGSGIAPLTSTWSPPTGAATVHTGLGNTISNHHDTLKSACEGTYSVVLSDANGCTSATFTLALVNCTSGIKQYNSNNDISIYPNPASSSLQVTFSGNIQNTTIEVYNTIGKCVHRQIAKSSNSQIDVSNLAEGVYQFIIHNSEFIITKRLVIVR